MLCRSPPIKRSLSAKVLGNGTTVPLPLPPSVPIAVHRIGDVLITGNPARTPVLGLPLQPAGREPQAAGCHRTPARVTCPGTLPSPEETTHRPHRPGRAVNAGTPLGLHDLAVVSKLALPLKPRPGPSASTRRRPIRAHPPVPAAPTRHRRGARPAPAPHATPGADRGCRHAGPRGQAGTTAQPGPAQAARGLLLLLPPGGRDLQPGPPTPRPEATGPRPFPPPTPNLPGASPGSRPRSPRAGRPPASAEAGGGPGRREPRRYRARLAPPLPVPVPAAAAAARRPCAARFFLPSAPEARPPPGGAKRHGRPPTHPHPGPRPSAIGRRGCQSSGGAARRPAVSRRGKMAALPRPGSSPDRHRPPRRAARVIGDVTQERTRLPRSAWLLPAAAGREGRRRAGRPPPGAGARRGRPGL